MRWWGRLMHWLVFAPAARHELELFRQELAQRDLDSGFLAAKGAVK